MDRFPSVLPAAGFFVASWLGAYLIAARGRDASALPAAASFLALGLYFLHAVLCLHLPAVEAGFLWRRFLGWFIVPAFAFWFHASVSASARQDAASERLLLLSYGAACVLSVSWLLGQWSFSSSSLTPVELRLPVSIYGLIASAASSAVWLAGGASKPGARPMALVSALLGLGAALLPHARLAHLPDRLAILGGHGLVIAAVAASGVLVGRTGLFTSSEVGRDMLLHLFTSLCLTALYGATIALSAYFALQLGFNPVVLTAIGVLAMAILTHVLVDQIRSVLDRLFLPDLAVLRTQLRGAAADLSRQNRVGVLEKLLESPKVVLGARWTYLHLAAGPTLGLPPHVGDPAGRLWTEGTPTDDLLRYPVHVGEQLGGYLLVGPRADARPYSEEERLWLGLLARHISLFLSYEAVAREEIEQLQDALQRLKELREEQLRLTPNIEQLPASTGPTRPEQVRRLLRAAASSGRLHQILGADTGFPELRSPSRPDAEELVRRALERALEHIRPPGEAPSLAQLRDRPVRKKRKARVPAGWAEYYVATLLLAGYTIEATAEQLGLSPRQVHHYLDRVATRLSPVLHPVLREILQQPHPTE